MSQVEVYFLFLATPHDIQDLNSLTRDQTHAPLQQKHRALTTGLLGQFWKYIFILFSLNIPPSNINICTLKKTCKESLILKMWHFFLFFFLIKTLFFQSNFRFIAKLRERYRDFPYPLSHTCIASSIINIPHQSPTFVATDELTLTHHKHQSPLLTLWGCIL